MLRFRGSFRLAVAVAAAALVGCSPAIVAADADVPPSVTVTMSNYNPDEWPDGSPSVTATAEFTDPDSATETYTCSVDYGDGTVVAGSVDGTTCVGPAHQYTAGGAYTVVVTVADSGGAVGTGTSGVVYTNRAPAVVGLGLVGDLRANHASHAVAAVIDPGHADETYTCTSIDYGDGSPLQAGTWVPDGWEDGLPRCVFPDHVFSTPGTYEIAAVVTDSGGLSGSAVFDETVLPEFYGAVAITGTNFDVAAGSAGFAGTLVATFSDAGLGNDPSETYSCTVAYGDSTGAQPGTIDGNTCLGPLHTYAAAGTYTAEVFLFDSDGSSDWASTTVTVANAAPIVTASGLETFGPAGVAWAGSVSFTDDPGQTHTCAIDYGDGAGPQSGVIAGDVCTGPMHTYASKGTYLFTATVTDSGGATGTYSTNVVVYNPVPIVGAVVAPATSAVGTAVTATASYVPTGLDPADSCTVDYGDGSGPLLGTADGTRCAGPAHVYVKSGTFPITVKVTAVTGAWAQSSAAISVALAVGPLAVTGQLVEGSSVSASASFTPFGTQRYTCKVDYGDGSGSVTGAVSGTTCKAPAHAFGRPGSYRISMVVTGQSGVSGQAGSTVAIANVAPRVTTLNITPLAKIGSKVSASASFTDPGSEAHAITWIWSDGSTTTQNLAGGVRAVSATHTFMKAGIYEVHVTVDDGYDRTTFDGPAAVIYDAARKIAGHGSFDAAAGSCQLTPRCEPAATAVFSFAASYGPNATRPSVSLALTVPFLKFASTAGDWLVVTGNVGVLRGSGTVNGVSGYTYELEVTDGPDTVQLTIYDSSMNLVYDGAGPLTSGCIAIS